MLPFVLSITLGLDLQLQVAGSKGLLCDARGSAANAFPEFPGVLRQSCFAPPLLHFELCTPHSGSNCNLRTIIRERCLQSYFKRSFAILASHTSRLPAGFPRTHTESVFFLTSTCIFHQYDEKCFTCGQVLSVDDRAQSAAFTFPSLHIHATPNSRNEKAHSHKKTAAQQVSWCSGSGLGISRSATDASVYVSRVTR